MQAWRSRRRGCHPELALLRLWRGNKADTKFRVRIAWLVGRFHTPVMAVPCKRGLLLFAICVAVLPVRADEIQLKDGKTFYGVIVAYDNNMFKVKTDFGFVLVQKDKIAAILPMASEAGKAEVKPTGKKPTRPEAANPEQEQVKMNGSADAAPLAEPALMSSIERPAARLSHAAVKPELPAAATTAKPAAPTIKGTPPASTASSALAVAAMAPPPPEPEVPANREDVQGNVYTNYTHGFKMYKAPSWTLLEDARKALPNAVVALGTLNQSTLLVIGQEESKAALEPAAATVEKRLSEIYDNYKRISQRKTVVGGLPAVEYHYRGMADGHDWSGTLVVISRGKDVFTVLGMTYADNDLIQIQENVINRSIASLDFNVH